MEGSEGYFDESEHVDGLAEEEVDETRENEREGCRSSEGSDFEGENEGEGYCGPEGSDFAAEESYEEGDPDAEEGPGFVGTSIKKSESTVDCARQHTLACVA